MWVHACRSPCGSAPPLNQLRTLHTLCIPCARARVRAAGGVSDRPAEDALLLGRVYDSLELEKRCSNKVLGAARAGLPMIARPSVHAAKTPRFPAATPAHGRFVDFASGSDATGVRGTIKEPFKTIARALATLKCYTEGTRVPLPHVGARTVVLRGGVHFLASTLQLTPCK